MQKLEVQLTLYWLIPIKSIQGNTRSQCFTSDVMALLLLACCSKQNHRSSRCQLCSKFFLAKKNQICVFQLQTKITKRFFLTVRRRIIHTYQTKDILTNIVLRQLGIRKYTSTTMFQKIKIKFFTNRQILGIHRKPAPQRKLERWRRFFS